MKYIGKPIDTFGRMKFQLEEEWITIAIMHTCCYLQWKKSYELLPATKFRHTKPIHVLAI